MTHELVITVLPEGSDRQEVFKSPRNPLPWPRIGEKVKLGPGEPLFTVVNVEHHIGRGPASPALSMVTYVEVEREL